MTGFTVIIATAGQPTLLGRTLASLATCRRPEGYRGTIVVEHGGQNVAEAIVAATDPALNCRYLCVPEGDKRAALTRALDKVADGLVFFTDDDVRLDEQALIRHATAAAAGGEPCGRSLDGPTGADDEREPARVSAPPAVEPHIAHAQPNRTGRMPMAWLIAAAVGLVAVGAFMTRDAWADIAHLAQRHEDAGHVLLAPIAVAWLAWARWSDMRRARGRGQWVGPLLVLLGWAMYSAGDTMLWQSVWHAGAIVVAVGCLLTLVGIEPLLRLAPAFAALAFLIPVPARIRQQIGIPLETITAAVAERVFDLAGAAVERSGNMLSLNGIDIAIAEACNGLRMVFALALVGYTFAFLKPMRPLARAVVLAGIPVMAVACNVVRLVPTVWLYAHHPGPVADAFHDLSGWAMLAVAFLLLVAVARGLEWLMTPSATDDAPGRPFAAPQGVVYRS